jgi:ribulose-5-phosphate 4-epimerase/fuculose-1-phosphate aldolase
MFYKDLAVYQGFGGVVLAKEEGTRIANALGQKRNIILRNHGILTSGGTVAEAAAFFIALERACQTQLLIEAAVANGNMTKTFVGEEEAEYTKKCTGSPDCMYMQFVPEYGLLMKETKGDFLS